VPTPKPEQESQPFAAELTDKECDRLAITHIDKKLLGSNEIRLFHTKWFDYRHLHPTKASILYAQEYLSAYRQGMQTRIDFNRGQYMRPFKGNFEESLFNISKRDYLGLWKGRQAADEMGIPYDFYCSAAITWAEENCWRYLPRPTQMYSTAMKHAIGDRWEDELEARTILPKRDATAHPDFISYLERQVNRREHKTFLLHRLIFQDKVLPDSLARERFGDQCIDAIDPDLFMTS